MSAAGIKQHACLKYTDSSLKCASFFFWKKQVRVKLKCVKYEWEVWMNVWEVYQKKKVHSAAHITQIHYRGWNLRIPLKMMKRCLSLVSDESLRVCSDLKTLWRLLLQVFKFIHQWNSHELQQFVRLRLSSLGGWWTGLMLAKLNGLLCFLLPPHMERFNQKSKKTPAWISFYYE